MRAQAHFGRLAPPAVAMALSMMLSLGMAGPGVAQDPNPGCADAESSDRAIAVDCARQEFTAATAALNAVWLQLRASAVLDGGDTDAGGGDAVPGDISETAPNAGEGDRVGDGDRADDAVSPSPFMADWFEALRASQRAWGNYRTAQCAAEALRQSEGVDLDARETGVIELRCRTRLTRARTKELIRLSQGGTNG
jgi:uncharacterized protein YecT (DUF1311 family)